MDTRARFDAIQDGATSEEVYSCLGTDWKTTVFFGSDAERGPVMWIFFINFGDSTNPEHLSWPKGFVEVEFADDHVIEKVYREPTLREYGEILLGAAKSRLGL